MVGSAIIGIANYFIYMATIDYMICAYGPYAASATGGNGWSRDFLAGVLTVPATPFYTNIGGARSCSAFRWCSCAPCMWYYYGPTLRKRSPFAESLASAVTSEVNGQPRRRVSRLPSHVGHGTTSIADGITTKVRTEDVL